MAVAPFEIIAGPADVYVAPVGTAFPVVNADPAAAWQSLGRTEGGVTVRHTQTIEQLRTDQNTGPVKAIRTEEGLEVEFGLAELTIENFAKALGIATVTAAAADPGPPELPATKSILLKRGVDVERFALLVRGPSPYLNANMQWEVPVVIQSEEPEVEFVKDDKSILSCVWVAMEDLDAPTDAEQFGRLIAQSA